MRPDRIHRFVTAAEVTTSPSPWGRREHLSVPGLTEAEKLYMVRMTMPPGGSHPFHRHPEMEELLYILSGRAEQWVDRTSRVLGPGDTAHIPVGVVHGTYNAGPDDLVFLAILSPARAQGEAVVDVSTEEPWRSLRGNA